VIVGTCRFELHFPESNSLKSKRHVLRSLKDRLRGRFNLSVAEVGGENLWQRCSLGVAVVANDVTFVRKVLSKVADVIAEEPRLVILDCTTEIV
jgi:uncharacterized protein YlxP (DUF503 family)